MNLRSAPRILLAAIALAAFASACGSDGDSDSETADTAAAATAGLVASVASYELEAGSPQRFMVGLLTNDQELVGYGTIDLAFSFKGEPGSAPAATATGVAAQGRYILIPGQKAAGDPDATRTVSAAEGSGVYAAEVTFDQPGLWQVQVAAEVDGRTLTTRSDFVVLDDSKVPEVGDPAPRTVNHLPGAEGVPPTGIDSRADGGEVPDTILHDTTVADAIGAGRPVMVVVSTPVYCVSRFCGPITESVEALAGSYADRMAFVHLEVWKDFEAKQVNKAAAEWIAPGESIEGAREPWVFVVDAAGTISHRYGNVVSDAELDQAVQDVLS